MTYHEIWAHPLTSVPDDHRHRFVRASSTTWSVRPLSTALGAMSPVDTFRMRPVRPTMSGHRQKRTRAGRDSTSANAPPRPRPPLRSLPAPPLLLHRRTELAAP